MPTRGAERAVTLALALALGLGCGRGAAPESARSPREALGELARCAFDGVQGDAPVARVEAALRLEVRRRRAEFAVRAGRCEDALRVGAATPPCLAPLRARWAELLPVAQRSAPDAIDLDVAVRRVGEAWRVAQACPAP
jgi:hypothetical protein